MGGMEIGLDRRRVMPTPLPARSDDVDFVAIDFETANRKRESACSVGIAIGPDDVVDAPYFPEIWEVLAPVLCSWRLARLTWRTFPSFGLGYLSGQLGLSLDHHTPASV